MNNKRVFLLVGIVYLVFCGIVLAGGIFEPTITNLNNDGSTDLVDFALMADNWQKTGTGLAGDFDDNNSVDIDDLMIFCWYWLTEYSEYQQCQRTDLDSDGIIAFEDVAKLAQNWLETGEGLTGDFDDSNSVDYSDLYIQAECWLQGSRPLCVWEAFKQALLAGDINKALTFIAEVSRDRYAEIFQIIEPNLPDYVAGMGDLILNSQEAGKVKYEMLHQDGEQTLLFPVFFVRDEDGKWEIFSL